MANVQMAEGMAVAAGQHYAGFWRRFIAFIIDWIIVSSAVAIVFLLLASVFPPLGDSIVLETPFGVGTTEKTIETKTTDSKDGNLAVKVTEKITEETVLGKWKYYFRVTETKRVSSSDSTTWNVSKSTRQRIDPVTHQDIKGTSLENIIALVLLIYWIVMETSRYQASFGKLVFGMKVVDREGKRLSIPTATGRNLLKILSVITLFIGFMMAGWTRRKQALHDKIVHCFVILPN